MRDPSPRGCSLESAPLNCNSICFAIRCYSNGGMTWRQDSPRHEASEMLRPRAFARRDGNGNSSRLCAITNFKPTANARPGKISAAPMICSCCAELISNAASPCRVEWADLAQKFFLGARHNLPLAADSPRFPFSIKRFVPTLLYSRPGCVLEFSVHAQAALARPARDDLC